MEWEDGERKYMGLDGVERKFAGPTFNEFVLETDQKASQVLAALRSKGVEAGIDLGRFYPELDRCILTCVTEMRTEAEIGQLVDAWRAL